jgi:hypothetical protein
VNYAPVVPATTVGRASGGIGIARIVGVARSLHSLGLFSVGANSSALRSIARSKNLASLEILALGDRFDDTAVEALLAAAFAPRLRSLHIVSDTPTTLPGIAEIRALVDLENRQDLLETGPRHPRFVPPTLTITRSSARG